MEKTVYKTACHICHGSCIAEVTVEDGEVTRIRPDPEGIMNKGRMCPKGRLSRELIYNPDRLLHPMKGLGKDWGANNLDEILEKRLDKLRTFPGYEDYTLDKLRETGWAAVPIEYEQFRKRAARGEKAFNTPRGKVELYLRVMEDFGFDPLPFYAEPPESPVSRPDVAADYPLVLTTGTRINAFFVSEQRQAPSLQKMNPWPLATLHPDTAARYGVEDGEWIYIETPRGRITQKARVTEKMRPGVVNCQMGWWFPEAKDKPYFGMFEVNANVLTTMAPPFDPAMGTYQLRGLLCRIWPNPEGAPLSARIN